MKLASAINPSLGLAAAILALLAGGAHAQKHDAHQHDAHQHGPSHRSGASPAAPPAAPVRITMEELHRHGGIPPNWRLTVPPGNPRAGRTAFVKLECYTCHTIKSERFPPVTKAPGPDLTGMGAHHPPEYFLESLLNPSAVIVMGPGYTGADGLSIMPDYRESLTVAELVDLIAYMRSLGSEHGQGSAGGAAPAHHPKGH